MLRNICPSLQSYLFWSHLGWLGHNWYGHCHSVFFCEQKKQHQNPNHEILLGFWWWDPFFFLHINFFCWAWPVSLQAKSWNFMDFVTKDFDERDRDRFHVAKDPDKKAMFGKKQYKFRLKSLFGYLPGTWNSFFFNHVETCNHPKETTVFHGCFKF